MAAVLMAAAIIHVSCNKKTVKDTRGTGESSQQAVSQAAAPQRPEYIPFQDSHPVIKDKALENRLAEEWGVKLHSLRITAAGSMIDMRFRVLDPEKAKPLLQKGAPVYLEHPKSGRKFFVPTTPKAGSLRATTLEPVKEKIYFILFANPGKYIRSGDQVTAVIADLKVEHLTVQ